MKLYNPAPPFDNPLTCSAGNNDEDTLNGPYDMQRGRRLSRPLGSPALFASERVRCCQVGWGSAWSVRWISSWRSKPERSSQLVKLTTLEKMEQPN